MSGELSKGNIVAINGGTTGLTDSLLQVIKLEKNAQGRYIAVISDSEKSMKALLPSSWDAKIDKKELISGSVFQLDKYVVNKVQGASICVMLELNVLQVDCVNIGNPTPVAAAATTGFGGNTGFGKSGGFGGGGNNPFKKQALASQAATAANSTEFQPVTALSPFQRDFRIKVRVTRKGDIRTWNNARGSGKLFSVDLLDMHGGEIQATMFNDVADKFFATFEEGKVYIICKGRVKVANKKFTHIENDYSIDLGNESEVEFVGDDSAIQTIRFDFKPLSDIANLDDKAYVDACGVCDQVMELQEFESKRTGKQLKKRNIRIVDQSGAAIECTSWGDEAASIDPNIQGQVICVKAGRVSDFNGKSLSINKIMVNPEGIPEVKVLAQWWAAEGSSQTFNSMTTSGGSTGGKNEPPISLAEIETKGFGQSDSPDYFNVMLTIKSIPASFEKLPWYKAVPDESISAFKVVESSDGAGWFCEKNGKNYDSYRCRFIMRLVSMDHTKDQWFNCYDDVAKKILGMEAGQVEEFFKNQDEASFKAVFSSAIGKQFNARCRAKQDTYNDEARTRCDIVGIESVNYVEDSKRMLGNIHNLMTTVC